MFSWKKLLKGTAVIVGTAAVSALCVFAAMGVFTRHTLTLTVNGTVSEYKYLPGETPDVSGLETAGPGERFICWLDGGGNESDPEVPMIADAAYTALIAPALAGEDMEPWLECDANGFAMPGALITGDEAAAGAEAIFASDFDASPLSALETVTLDDFAAALDGAFAPGELEALSDDSPLTRVEAAQLVCSLAGIEDPGAPNSPAAPDLDPASEGAAELARCLAPETAVEYADGFVNIDGWLYLVRGGLFVTDESVDGFEFGPDGRFTSGNEELDELVAEALEPICAEGGTRDEMLRAAYLYVRDNFEYLRRNYYAVGADGWQTDEAITMLTTGRGNCYCYAAAFWALARGLGYDATAVAGTVGYDRDPHGWVIMYDEDGTRITYDVELEMAYRYNRHNYTTDMYAMNPIKAAQWSYVYGEQFR